MTPGKIRTRMIFYLPERVMPNLLKKYRISFLFICGTLLYVAANIQRTAIPGAVFDQLQMKWSLSAPQVTSFGAYFMYVYAAAQLFVGLFCDRYGGIRVIMWGGVLFTAGGFIFALLDNYILLCTGRILVGMGASTFYLGLITETIRYFRKNYSICISVIVMTGYAGGIIANAPFSWLTGLTGLRGSLSVIAGFSLICYILYMISCRGVRRPPVRQVSFSIKPFVSVLKVHHNWFIAAFCSLNWGLYYSLQTVIGKKFLEDYCSIPTGNAAVLLSVTSVISAVSGFVYAIISKKSGNRRKPLCLLTGLTAFTVFLLLFLITAFDIRNTLPAFLICCLAGTASLSSVIIPLINETNSSNSGAMIALNNFTSYIMVAVFGTVIGRILNMFPPETVNGRMIYSREAYLTLFTVMFICSAVVLFSASKLKETFGKRTIVK